MAWRNDWLWALPPDSTYNEIDEVLRRMRWLYRWQRFKARFGK